MTEKNRPAAKADNRQRLEDAALDAVPRTGFKALSFRTLAASIGVKSSSVHYHFPDKSDLARTLLQRYSRDFSEHLRVIDQQQTTLFGILDAFIGIFEQVAREEKLCLCGMLAAEVDQLDETNRAVLVEYFSTTVDWLAQHFDIRRKALRVDIESQELAHATLSGLEGALLLDRAAHNSRCIAAQRSLILSWVKQ